MANQNVGKNIAKSILPNPEKVSPVMNKVPTSGTPSMRVHKPGFSHSKELEAARQAKSDVKIALLKEAYLQDKLKKLKEELI